MGDYGNSKDRADFGVWPIADVWAGQNELKDVKIVNKRSIKIICQYCLDAIQRSAWSSLQEPP